LRGGIVIIMKKEEFYREALPDSKGPLEGIIVLEATTTMAGPMVGMVLADLGAECIKIDQPGVGDMLRYTSPFIGPKNIETSTFHLTINRNKKNITLNLKAPEGKEIFKRLAQRADIIIENFKPGTMEKWGLGYRQIKEVKPDIIYVSISGYGQYGPHHHKPSYDAVGQAYGGLMSVTGHPDDPPTRCGFGIADTITGWQGAIGCLAALHYRNMTGRGQHIDVSQVDTMVYATDQGIMATANAGYKWRRMGSQHPGAVPYDAYRCKDGYVFIAIALDSHWARFCQIIGREELIDDPRTAHTPERTQNRDFVNQVVSDWVRGHTVAEVTAICDQAGIVACPIMTLEDIIEDRHLQEREMVVDILHPVVGKTKITGIPIKYSLTPAKHRRPAPLLGQHNQEIYHGWLGISQKELDILREKKVI